MQKTHIMTLRDEIFDLVVAGMKTIEVRLNDTKRRLIAVEDQIEFKDQKGGTVMVRVLALLPYKSFAELLNAHTVQLFGYESIQELQTVLSSIYTKQQEKECGVLGIRFEVLDS